MPEQIRRGAEGRLDLTPELLSGVDAVVHLAGENVATGDGPLGFLGVQVSVFLHEFLQLPLVDKSMPRRRSGCCRDALRKRVLL